MNVFARALKVHEISGFHRAREILDEVAEEAGVTVERFAGYKRKRSRTISVIRREAMERVRDQTKLSTSEIGELLSCSGSTVSAILRRKEP